MNGDEFFRRSLGETALNRPIENKKQNGINFRELFSFRHAQSISWGDAGNLVDHSRKERTLLDEAHHHLLSARRPR